MSQWKSHNTLKTLDFDLETLAAGFADPAWVPQKITACAWSWVGSEQVHVNVDPRGYHNRDLRRKLLLPLLEAISEADVLQGHNILRFDLRVLQAECMRLNLSLLQTKRVVDTIKLPKSLGFKKGQDDISTLLGIPVKKKTLNWQEWDDAYEEGRPWPTVKARCAGDVVQHKLMVEKMRERGWLSPGKEWKP